MNEPEIMRVLVGVGFICAVVIVIFLRRMES